MMKKRLYVLMLFIPFLCLLGACSRQKAEKDDGYTVTEEPTIQTNFYQTINKEWLSGHWTSVNPLYNEFTRLQIEVDERLRNDFEQMASGAITPQTEDQIEFIKLYQKGFDFAARRKDGTSSIQTRLDEITSIDSFSELATISQEWLLKEYPLPYGVEVIVNPKNTSESLLMLTAPKTILPDKSYYEDLAKKEQLMGIYRISVSRILVKYGYKEEEANQLVDKAIAFDARLAPFLSVREEENGDWKSSNESEIRPFSEVIGYSTILAIEEALSGLIGSQPSVVYVSAPAYFSLLNDIIQEENFSDYKAWALVSQMLKLAPYMTGEIMQMASQLRADLQGQPAAFSNEYVTYLDVTNVFKKTISSYYGQHYADDEAIKEVKEMTQAIVKTYKERILASDWLSSSTKQAAVKKLEHIAYHIGYQEEVSGQTLPLHIDASQSYAENMLAIQLQNRKASFAHYGDSIDRASWNSAVSSSDVTATYSPYQNAIYIPAAILQAPYYDKNQSIAENYGGIGKIIAHEIVHAFDSVGSHFDETGSLNNWWTNRDRKRFDEKTQALVEMFDGLEIYGGKVNGKRTLVENIADLGGVQIALETLKREDTRADLRSFFEHYAISRREQVSSDYGKYMLATETHAPEEFRVNIPLQQIDDFYKTYDIQQEDPMYRPQEDRVIIW